MRPRPPRNRPEPTIALINVVFLMLIFFMVAGTLAPPQDPDLTLVNTADLEGREPADALVIAADGQLRYRGNPVADPAPYLATLENNTVVRVVPDQKAPAHVLLAVSRDLRAAGAEKVMIVTEKALQ